MSDFVHLHVHSEYSLLDGAIRVKDLVEQAAMQEMPAVALTDHGNMFGAIKFYKACLEANITPLLGCEMYVAPGSRHTKEQKPGREIAYHLVLLAENLDGWKNLTYLVSMGHLEGFYYRPRIDRELLEKHNEGLIALSACLHGEVAHALVQGREDKAGEAARFYRDLFGEENFFIELQDAGIEEQRRINPGLVSIAKELGLGTVATNDCHYLRKEDAKAHDILLCIQTGKTVMDQDRMRFSTDEIYFKSAAEMAELFPDYPEAITNTGLIAQRCQVELPLGRTLFPKFTPANGKTVEEEFVERAREGLKRRFEEFKRRGIEVDEDEYWQRLEYEIDVISRMGFPGYFLVVADFITWAKEQDIPVGPGRGSAAGSLVSYSMRITDLDPILYGLFFERFLTLERKSMPDIDIDFCEARRSQVLAYVRDKYSKNNVAQIITFGTLSARAVIRDVGRALGLSYGEVDRIAKLVPNRLKIKLKSAVKEEPRLKAMMDEDPRVAELISVARRLEGLPKNASTHAAGVVISPNDIVEYLPLHRATKHDSAGDLDLAVTQFDMKDVEKVGLIKFDFLGLKTLTVIDNAVHMIRRGPETDFDIDAIPMNDAPTYALVSRGETSGIFQLESSGMRALLTRLLPSRFEDVIALVALYRPGPLESGMVDDFVERKHGRAKVTYPHPDLEPILKETHGVIVYQEQVMEIARVLAGYSLGEGDILRRAMGKKIPEIMAEQRSRFLSGAKEAGVDPKLAGDIFDLIDKFAGYGFNKSHSASYAMIAYQTAYLKEHFPVQFMAALLTSETNNTDKVVRYIAECRDMEIDVLPPDVNESDTAFTVAGEGSTSIRFGLGAVKNVGASAIESIALKRDEGGLYRGLSDFCERVDLRKVNRRVIESLIKCGAFDFTGAPRAALLIYLDEAMAKGQAIQRAAANGQTSMFDAFATDDGTSGGADDPPKVDEWRESKRLAFEKEALGFYITGHPLDSYADLLGRVTDYDTAKLQSAKDKSVVRIGGVVIDKKEIMSKKGRMAFISVEDLHGTVEVVVFSDVFEAGVELLDGEAPVLITAEVDRDESGVKLLAKSISPLAEAQAQTIVRYVVTIPGQPWSRQRLTELKSLLIRHRGPCRTFLRLELDDNSQVTVALPEAFRVTPSDELTAAVTALLGPETVERYFA